jgi:hypothetical protein
MILGVDSENVLKTKFLPTRIKRSFETKVGNKFFAEFYNRALIKKSGFLWVLYTVSKQFL